MASKGTAVKVMTLWRLCTPFGRRSIVRGFFARGRESTYVTFVLENPDLQAAFIFAKEQS